MGTWQPIGTLTANYDWQYFPNLATESEFFRLKQRWTKQPFGKAYLVQVYNSSEFYGFRRFFPSEETCLLTLPIPDDYRLTGVTTRQIALKLSLYTRTYLDWQFELEIFN